MVEYSKQENFFGLGWCPGMLRCFSPFGNVLAGLLALGMLSQTHAAVAQVRRFADQPSSGISGRATDTAPDHDPGEGWDDFKPGLSQDFQGLANVDGTQGQWQLVEMGMGNSSWAQINNSEESPQEEGILLNDLDLDPDIIQDSPVLQDWLQDIPDIADEIRNQPSFRTRLRVGYAQFPSSDQATGVYVGVEDVFLISGTGLTAAGSFSRSWNDERESFGAEVRYYLLPLGSYVNIAPTLGYRSLETPDYTTNGVDVGFRLMMIPSRGGGADIALGQHWVSPGSRDEVGMTSISVGYAVTPRLRLGTDLEFQYSRLGPESRVGLLLEWLM